MDFEIGWSNDQRWLAQILRDEMWAFSDFATVPYSADGAIGQGLICDDNPANCWGPAADDRSGVARATIPLSNTLRITAGPPGSAYGVTSGQRNPSFLIRWIPVAPSANLSSQRAGFVAVAAADTSAGVYLRSTTTGNLFFVARSEAGAEATVDLGVSPTTMTEYRIFTNDAGLTWGLERDGVSVAGAMVSTSLPVTTTRLLPEVRVIATASGSVVVDLDLLSIRAWKGTPPVTLPDRLTARDFERRMQVRALLAWADFVGYNVTTPDRIIDLAVGNAGATITNPTTPPGILINTGDYIGPLYWTAAGATPNLRLIASPSQSPLLQAHALVQNSGATTVLMVGWVGSVSATANGAYFRRTGTGNLLFVTRQSGVETTTDTGAAPTVTYEDLVVRTLDGGVTWQGLRNGVIVATHTTNVPTLASALGWICQAISGGTQGLGIKGIFALCDRLR